MSRSLRIWMPTIRSGSGADVFTTRLADGLRHAGHDPIVQWLDLRYEIAPWLLRSLPMPQGTDIVHTGCIPGFALARSGTPLVVTEHQYLKHPAFVPYSRGMRRLYQKLLVHEFMSRTYERADRIVAVSRHCADIMHRDLDRHIDVIHNWVDHDVYAACDRLGTPKRSEPFKLLFVGNPSPWKGSDMLAPLARMLGPTFSIEAMGGLRKTLSFDDSSPRNLHAIASRHPGDMPAVYARADAVLVLSRYESFGYVALEAMAAGRAVVGFDAPGTNEVCVDGSTALLVPIDDLAALVEACNRLASDETLTTQLGMAGSARAESHFSEQAGVSRYIDVYESVVDAASTV